MSAIRLGRRSRGAANTRHGSTPKTIGTELVPVRVNTPRDRDGSFEPQLVAKRQTRLAGLDDRVLDLYSGGMSVRDIAAHLSGLYGVAVGLDTISRVTDAVLDDVAASRTRPLEAVYPVVYFDAMQVKVREDRSCYLAVGVTVEGDRECLGIWWQDTEGAKFWLAVLNDLHRRGVADVLIACVDGLTGFPDAIEAVYPKAWVQTCIVHEIRNSMRYVNYRDRKAVARDLRPVYTAPNAEAAEHELAAFDEQWGTQHPMIADMWRRDWQHIVPFLALPDPLRKTVYTTNTNEAMHRRSEKRSRRAATSPTNKPRPSSSTSRSRDPKRNGDQSEPGQPHSQHSQSTSETDSPSKHEPSRPDPTHSQRTPSKRPTTHSAPHGCASRSRPC